MRGVELALPAAIFLLLTLVIPLALLVPFGFRDTQVHQGVITSSQFTLSHLTAVLGDPHTYALFWRSFWVACCVTTLCLFFGLPVAHLYSVAPRAVRAIILVVVVAPMLTSAIVRTYAWLVILGGRNGLVNGLLLAIGWIDRPLRIINTPWAVLIGLTQLHLPFMILPLIAVLGGRDRRLDQASLNLGASRVATFFRVVLPLAVPGIGAGSAIVFSFSYTTFVPPQLLGGGNYSNAATTVYEQIVPLLDWGKGGVMALLLLVTCLACLAAMSLAIGRACPLARARMSGFTWTDRIGTAALILVATATLLMLAAPAFIVLAISVDIRPYVSFPPAGFTLHWYADILDQRQIVGAFLTSLEVAAAVTLACVLLGIPAAFASVRGRFPGRRTISTLIMAPQTMPGIVVGVAILFAGSSVGLFASTPMLIAALVTVLIAVPTRISIARLSRLDPSLERASENLGATRWQGFLRVTLPQLLPAVAGGAAFTFIEAFDNVSVAMFTHSYRARPLAIELLSLVETDNSPLVAAISGVEIALACLVVGIIAATAGLGPRD